MSATIELFGKTATINLGKWTCEDKHIEKLLNTITPAASGADPNPDYTAAKNAIDQIGGNLKEYTKLKFVKNRVY